MTTATDSFIGGATAQGGDEEDEQLAIGMREVDEELYVFPPSRDYIEHLPFSAKSRTFSTPLLDSEHEAIENCEARASASDLAEICFEVPPPTRAAGLIETNDEFATWNKCLDQLKLRLEYGQRQLLNLELMKSQGNLAWAQCITEAESLESALKANLVDLSKQQQIQEDINWRRKSDQELVAKQLQVLQREWHTLEERNRALSEAIKKL